MVVSGDGRTTVALCLRRDALRAVRSRNRGMAAGIAVESYLRECCPGVAAVLRDADRQGNWLAVGPLRPGGGPPGAPGIHRVGNAGAEVHPLVGEGMHMALQSSRTLAHACRTIHPARDIHARALRIQPAFAFRRLLCPHRHAATACRAGRPDAAAWPTLLTTAAMLAGKARSNVHSFDPVEEHA